MGGPGGVVSPAQLFAACCSACFIGAMKFVGIGLVPTSSGLQPYEIVVVTSPAVPELIKPIAWNQGQITDGST